MSGRMIVRVGGRLVRRKHFVFLCLFLVFILLLELSATARTECDSEIQQKYLNKLNHNP